jgi:hypothetical protein
MKRLFILFLLFASLSLSAQVDSLQFAIDVLQRVQDRKQSTPKPKEPIRSQTKLLSAFNVSTEADQLVNNYLIAKDSIKALRAFVLLEKGLLNDGMIAEGGKHPKDTHFEIIPNREGRGSWNGNFFQNFMRYKAMRNQVDILIGVPENIVRWDSRRDKIVFAQFLYKNWQLWQYGNTPQEQYNKCYEHFLAWLNSMTYFDDKGVEVEIFDYVEIMNEPWGFTNEEYKIVESARVEAWLEYNRQRGRYPISQANNGRDISKLSPKLGTCAVPLGQGYTPKKGSMTMLGMVSKYAPYYTYVSGHVYNIDNNGWSDDFEITKNQFKILEEFRHKYYPKAKLFISEIGSKITGDQKRYVQNVVAELSQNPNVMGIGWYSLRPIPNARFGECYYQDQNGKPTNGMKEIKRLTDWKAEPKT